MPKVPVDLIKRALEEDGAFADITTLSTVSADQWSTGSIVARQAGVVAGLAVHAGGLGGGAGRKSLTVLPSGVRGSRGHSAPCSTCRD